MSKLAKKPIAVPKEVKISIAPDAVTLTGAKGSDKVAVPKFLKVEHDQKSSSILVKRNNDEKQSRAMQGTVYRLLMNAIVGVTQGYKKDVELRGAGYNAALKGATLVFNVGYAHPVERAVPQNLKVGVTMKKVEREDVFTISIEGVSKHAVGQFAADLKSIRTIAAYQWKKGVKGFKLTTDTLSFKERKGAVGGKV